MDLVEMPQPVALQMAERVGLGLGQVGRGEPAAALGVGEHREDRIQPPQAGRVPDIEQARVRAVLGPSRGSITSLIPHRFPEPASDPQQSADGLAQHFDTTPEDRRAIGPLQ